MKDKDVKPVGSQGQVVNNDAPDNKFQNEQKVVESTGVKANTGESGYTLEKKKAPGSQLKQEIASSIVKDSTLTGGNSGDGASFGGLRSSGSFGGIVGAANATPNVGKPDRRDGRTGKKLDRNATKLNYIPCDQVLTEWDESKPLCEAADKDQGYDGTYRNEFARSQKVAENVPGALMFDRSVDLCVKDQIYFGQGQLVKQNGVTTEAELTKIPQLNEYGQYQNSENDNYVGGALGNYLPKNLFFKHDAAGHLQYLIFDEEDITVTGVNEHVANKSSAAYKVMMNRAELWREVIDSKAGDEKADIWSCLARAVRQPTATVGFLEAIEADVGNEIITSLVKTEVCSAFQLNRAHKDGQDDVFPGILALTGFDTNFVSSEYAKTVLPSSLHDVFAYEASGAALVEGGAASTIIPLYDSPNKYNTKVDIALQPRSVRMHVQTALNNIDPLYADKDYISMLAVNEAYSTIERDYDPNGLVFMTDKTQIVHRVSWNRMGSFIKEKFNGKVTVKDQAASDHLLLSKAALTFAKSTGMNMYLVYFKEAAGSITYATGKFVAGATYEFANGTKFDLIFAAETPTVDTDVYNIVTVANADIVTTNGLKFNFKGDLDYFVANYLSKKLYFANGGPARYMYNDLRNNYVITVNHPLLKGLADYLEEGIGAKYYTVSHGAEVNITIGHSSMYYSLWSILLCAATPYITKERVNSFRDVLYYEKNVEYPFKDALVSVGELKHFNFKNFTLTDIDTELETKVMLPAIALKWVMPEMLQQVGYDTTNSELKVLLPWYSNQNECDTTEFKDDVSTMSFPSIRSGVRFSMLDALYGMDEKDVRLSLDKVSAWLLDGISFARSLAYKYSSVTDGQLVLAIPNTGITGLAWMKLPRELGYVFDAPYGILTPDYSGNRRYNSNIIGTHNMRVYYWTGANPVSHECGGGTQSILAANTVNINRAANFTQQWYAILASGTTVPVDHGFVLSLGQLFSNTGAMHLGDSYFKPYQSVDGTTNVTSGVNGLISFQKALWTRLQKLPFVISPFDLKVIDNTASPNNALIPDLFDFMYMFGLGGFRASDFRESVYNREKEVVNQGYLFVRDPWVVDSPLFREGSTASNIKMTKGFEV